jgi:hypothetical protein
VLNEMEANAGGSWRVDTSELTSAAKFSDQTGKLAASGLSLDVVVSSLRSFLLKTIQPQPATISPA